MEARFEEAEDLLLTSLNSGALDHRAGRGLSLTVTGFNALLGQRDAPAARRVLAGVLAELEANAATPAGARVAAWGHALAALVFASPLGHVFSPERVHRHAAATRASTGSSDGDARALAAAAELQCAFHVGELARMRQLVSRHRNDLTGARGAAARLLADDSLALTAFLCGRLTEAAERYERIVGEAQRVGFASQEQRARGRLGMVKHMVGSPRTEVLEVVRRAREITVERRLAPSNDDVERAAVEAEVLHGLARFEEAQRVVEEAHEIADRVRWPPADLLMVQTRLTFHHFGVEGVQRLASDFKARFGADALPWVEACASFLDGLAAQMRGDNEASIRFFRVASELASATRVRPWLELFSNLLELASHAYLGQIEQGELCVRRVDRALDRLPSPFFDTVRGHLVGVFLSVQGRTLEAKQQFEAAFHTLISGGDTTETARLRRALAVALHVRGDATADAMLERSARELEELGIPLTRFQKREHADVLASHARGRSERPTDLALSGLVVPVERVAVRGLSPDRILAELVDLVSELAGGRGVALAEIDDDEGFSVVGGEPDQMGDHLCIEFGDGCGRRFRMGVETPVTTDRNAAINVLVKAAALSLEVHALRALSSPTLPHRAESVTTELPGFIAASSAMLRLLDDISRLGRSSSTVLISGESGAGKEVVAHAVHRLSTRRDEAYVTFNSTAVPENLFEGQLFGYARGAFTGATTAHLGVIRSADGGTLFLDEIGDLPLSVQPKLLRFLENSEVLPLGESRPVQVNVRIVAATHRDLRALVNEGKFREDLFYRLNVVTLKLPPLRKRRDDILPLARHFIRSFTPADASTPRLSPDAVVALRAHPWLGNVRELRNVLERTLAFSPLPTVITAEHLGLG